jgi:hypothetical protein
VLPWLELDVWLAMYAIANGWSGGSQPPFTQIQDDTGFDVVHDVDGGGGVDCVCCGGVLVGGGVLLPPFRNLIVRGLSGGSHPVPALSLTHTQLETGLLAPAQLGPDGGGVLVLPPPVLVPPVPELLPAVYAANFAVPPPPVVDVATSCVIADVKLRLKTVAHCAPSEFGVARV